MNTGQNKKITHILTSQGSSGHKRDNLPLELIPRRPDHLAERQTPRQNDNSDELSLPNSSADGSIARAVESVTPGIEFERHGKTSDAITVTEDARALNPQLREARPSLIGFAGRQERHTKAGRRQRAARPSPSNPWTHYGEGVHLAASGRHSEAAKAFRRALAADPNHTEAHHSLAQLLEQQGRLGAALEHYRAAVAIRPDCRLAHFHIARILVERRNYSEGIAHLLQTLSPEDHETPLYLSSLSIAYGRSGETEKAIHYGRRARQWAASLEQTELVRTIEHHLQSLGVRF